MATLAAVAAPTLPVSIDDVRAAHDRIRASIVRTPTLISRTLSQMTGATVYLKFENLQFTAAYKERGALNTLLQLSPEACAKGVIAASAGNHAQGLAYHANRLGIPATIVGVAPASFLGTQSIVITDLWVPATLYQRLAMLPRDPLVRRESTMWKVVARLAPGVSLAQGRAALEVLATRIGREFPDAAKGTRLVASTSSSGQPDTSTWASRAASTATCSQLSRTTSARAGRTGSWRSCARGPRTRDAGSWWTS